MKGFSMKKGFTLAEALTTMGILGVIAAICIPTVMSRRPNQDIVMCKKAYHHLERVVAEIFNDEDCYDTSTNLGLGDTSSVEINGVECEGDGKFCCLFVLKSNSIDPPECTAEDNTLLTTDNVSYVLPISDFDAAETITIDVNGPNRGGNTTTGDKPDQFVFSIRPTGQITLGGTADEQARARAFLNAQDLTSRTFAELQ